MIVLQYNTDKINVEEVNDCFESIVDYAKSKFPKEDIIAIPDGISLLQLDNYELTFLVKAFIEYAKLKEIDIEKILKECNNKRKKRD
jgi:hypothetical protein